MPSVPATTRLFRRLAGRLRHSEEGLTLIELLVAMTMLTGILAGSTALLIGMMQKQPGLSDRSHQVEEARVTLDRMVREMRVGYAVDSVTGTAATVTFRTYLHSTCAGVLTTTVSLCRVTYTCTPTTKICTRRLANANGTSPTVPRPLIEGVTNSDVFTIQSSYIGVKFVIPTADGRGSLTVNEGARLRNAPTGV
jgi:Tfp pilus assembly protein PilW